MVFLPNLGVNLRACLCGVVNYASAQALDFLDLGQKSAFLDWKLQNVPIFDNSLLWMGTT
jgi:predicted membrane-bound spermidine synthase